MSKSKLLALIPFSGFYETQWSRLLDSEIEQLVENDAERETSAEYYPPELRLSEGEIGDFAWEYLKTRDAELAIAKDYVHGFNISVSGELGFNLRLAFESLKSPKYYNYETDRIFAHVPAYTARRLFKMSRENGHAALAEIIERDFTSRDGFASHYSNDVEAWLEKPLMQWDHNEIGTLILACLHIPYSNPVDRALALMGEVSDGEFIVTLARAVAKEKKGTRERPEWEREVEDYVFTDSYSYLDGNFNWEGYEAKKEEIRDIKRADILKLAPNFVPPAERCPNTPDMFRPH